MKNIFFQREQFIFLPLLIIYLIIIGVFSSNELAGDEIRHMHYANNLAEGYYTEADNPEIGNGPGYPIFITPFVSLGIPLVFVKLLNAFLLFGAVLFFFKTLKFYLPFKKSVVFSYILGFYPPFMKYSVLLHSELLALFLICGFLYNMIKLHKSRTPNYINLFLSAIFLGLLTLTKVIFSYVLLLCLIVYSFIYFWKKISKVKLIVLTIIGAFIICSPFLAYTYSITGKPFYWGTQGGSILYYRSTPFPNEVGNWMDKTYVYDTISTEYFGLTEFRENHKTFIDSIIQLTPMDQDILYKKKAIENIKNHPIKYLKNTFASASRLFFNYPYSYTPQKVTSLAYIIPNTLLLFTLIFSLYLIIINLKSVPFEVYFLGLFSIAFMGGLILLDGRVRHLSPAIPILAFVVIVIFNKFLTLKIKNE
ncbi:glycosyltransferase family 39 protein [Zobellia roscoffensis]|uniref:glycosyltransferase family 39 protein n=1 Tax=Zobellia roscoffensis TaxID=2779508 RepID=UPI00188A3E9F|nr:glycosyltransferase family 39 protein [Zobellia roscoffensis]